MAYLLDSNILLRFSVPSAPEHADIRTALRILKARGEDRCYTAQNLAEFWNVFTRPVTARGGFGRTPSQADRATRIIERLFTFLPESQAVHEEWRRLINLHGVSGVEVYDARLAAYMRIYGIGQIVTLNIHDFSRFGVIAIHPGNV